MSFQSKLLVDANGKKYLFRVNSGAELVEGTAFFSSRNRPISKYYDRQYRLLAGGDVFVVQSGEIVALLPDFDPNFVLEMSELNAVSVIDADDNAEVVYIMAGDGLLNEGTSVYDDPAGNIGYDGVIVMGRYQITIVGGLVVSVETIDKEPEMNPSKVALIDEDGKKNLAYVNGSIKLLLTVGTEVFADEELSVPFKFDGWFTNDRLSVYSFLLEGGVVKDVKKAEDEGDGRK